MVLLSVNKLKKWKSLSMPLTLALFVEKTQLRDQLSESGNVGLVERQWLAVHGP
jgi:hypothetical protein